MGLRHLECYCWLCVGLELCEFLCGTLQCLSALMQQQCFGFNQRKLYPSSSLQFFNPRHTWCKHLVSFPTLSLPGAHKRGAMLHNPCVLGGPHERGQYHNWEHHPTFSGAHEWAQLLHNPCVLGGPHQRVQNQKWLHHPYLLGGPQEGKSVA